MLSSVGQRRVPTPLASENSRSHRSAVKTVLLVEDDEDTRTIYSLALQERGYRVLTANHGAEGVYLARRYSPDLVLLDIRMPIMDGWHAVEYLKHDVETRSIPVWGISAHFDDQPAEGSGFSRLIPKPLPPNDMVALVEGFLGPAG